MVLQKKGPSYEEDPEIQTECCDRENRSRQSRAEQVSVRMLVLTRRLGEPGLDVHKASSLFFKAKERRMTDALIT